MLWEQLTDLLLINRGKFKIEYGEVLNHVLFGTGPGQRHNSDISEIAEKDLRLGFAILLSQVSYDRVVQNMRISGQCPETLISHSIVRAPFT